MQTKVKSRKRLDLENKVLCFFLRRVHHQFSVFVFICISHYCSTGQPKMARVLSTYIHSPGLERTSSQSSPWVLLFMEHIWRRGRAPSRSQRRCSSRRRASSWLGSGGPCAPGDGSRLMPEVTSQGGRCLHTLLLDKGSCCCSRTSFPEDQMKILPNRLNLRPQDFE